MFREVLFSVLAMSHNSLAQTQVKQSKESLPIKNGAKERLIFAKGFFAYNALGSFLQKVFFRLLHVIYKGIYYSLVGKYNVFEVSCNEQSGR